MELIDSNGLKKKPLPVAPLIERRICLIRGQKVMLDNDLATLYGTATKVLIQAVKRNEERFPDDFMFRLTHEEAESMRSQIVTASKRNVRYQPYAFTELGVAMLSSVLRSRSAALMNIEIMRAFARLRELMAANKDFATRIEKLENSHHQTTSIIGILADEIDSIAREVKDIKKLPQPLKRKIGFDI